MDIRMETYQEALASYLDDAKGRVVAVGDPAAEIAKYGIVGLDDGGQVARCHTSLNDPAHYPTGTWFYFPGDGMTYVREK